MSSSSIQLPVFQAKIGSIQNQADSTSIYSNGVWSFKNSTALTSVTITDAGNVGIGTASPALLNFGRELMVSSTSGGQPESFLCLQGARTTDANVGGLVFFNSSTSIASIAAARTGANNSGALIFGTVNAGVNAERMRIDASGNLLVGTTNTDPPFNRVNGLVITQSGVLIARQNNAWNLGFAANSGNHIQFYTDNGSSRIGAGIISSSGSTTSYASSSDYRLKENVQPMSAALAKVASLKPCTYTWKSDGIQGEGFIAHELEEVYPLAVVGEKDAVNEDGSIKAQGIDPSKLVALLTAAIQELSAKNDALEARLAALEAK